MGYFFVCFFVTDRIYRIRTTVLETSNAPLAENRCDYARQLLSNGYIVDKYTKHIRTLLIIMFYFPVWIIVISGFIMYT